MLAYGLEKFISDAANAEVDGFIVPDLPVEEAGEFTSALTSYPLGSGASRQG
jgi:tryptophan synthase alpha subunit